MGFIRDDFGRITIESRRESFYIHPSYGHTRECPTCLGDPPPAIMGPCAGGCSYGRVPDHINEHFDKQWTEHGHPEFLNEDLDDLIAALIDFRNDEHA